MRDPRLVKLADILVNYSTRVQPGQIVRLVGSPLAHPLLTEVYRQVIRAGGHPLVRMAPDDWNEIFYKTANDEQLRFVNPIAEFEIEKIDVTINVRAEENTKSLSNTDSQRVGLGQSARKPIMTTFMKRSASGELRWVGTQYPTPASAQDAMMSLSEYEDFVFDAGLLNTPDPVAAWQAVSKRQQALTDLLNEKSAAGKGDYRVVAANGTDLRMSVAGHTWINCDGQFNFPDGEVFTGPVIGSVNGTAVFSFPAVHHGREVQDVRLTFRDGKVVDASASAGEEFLIAMLDMDAGSRLLGECAIGTNYSITRYTKNTLFDEKIGGTVHFALGAGYPETGNNNESGLHWDMVIDLRQGGHIEIEGQRISENGTFSGDQMPR